MLDYDDELRKLDGERAKMVGLVLSLDSYADCLERYGRICLDIAKAIISRR